MQQAPTRGAPTRARRTRRATIVLAVLVLVVALACGAGAATAATFAINITQPVSSSHTIVKFVVKLGDTTASIAQRLQDDGLIRNALLFRLWARYKHRDTGIEPGVYALSPSMTMDTIMVTLQQSKPQQQIATVPDSLRVTQYPAHLTNLPSFNAQDFLRIVKTGQFADGTLVSARYWYVLPPQKGASYALEGYLYPDTYSFDANATASDVVTRMLDTLGEHLCPGPASQPDAYIHDETQCEAHAVPVGNTDIFTAMELTYFTTNPAQALYDTLTLAALTTREIRSYADAPGVAAVYYNRYLSYLGKKPSDTAGYMGSDPSAEYARDTDNPPSNGQWWAGLQMAGDTVDCASPYNMESPCHQGLPPGPIAAPIWPVIVAAAAPPNTPDFYFVSNQCGKLFYWTNLGDFDAQNAAAQANDQC